MVAGGLAPPGLYRGRICWARKCSAAPPLRAAGAPPCRPTGSILKKQLSWSWRKFRLAATDTNRQIAPALAGRGVSGARPNSMRAERHYAKLLILPMGEGSRANAPGQGVESRVLAPGVRSTPSRRWMNCSSDGPGLSVGGKGTFAVCPGPLTEAGKRIQDAPLRNSRPLMNYAAPQRGKASVRYGLLPRPEWVTPAKSKGRFHSAAESR